MTSTGVPGKVRYLLDMRDRARRAGDENLQRAFSNDLAREGYLETTQAPELEQALPPQPRRGGRPKLPRCEHGRIVGRCEDCEHDDPVDYVHEIEGAD